MPINKINYCKNASSFGIVKLFFIRVDFFDTDEQLFIAEMTFAPGGGATPYHPESFNKLLGDKFILPNK